MICPSRGQRCPGFLHDRDPGLLVQSRCGLLPEASASSAWVCVGGHCIHSQAHCKSRVVGLQRLRLAFQRLCRQYLKAAVEKCAHPDQTCSRVGWDLGVVFQLELLNQPGICSPPWPLWLCLQALALSPSGAMLPFPCSSSQPGPV